MKVETSLPERPHRIKEQASGCLPNLKQPDAVGIIIPAHNEAKHISRCLRAVARAVANLDQGVSAWTVLVADRCSDATATLAETLLREGEVLHCAACCAGEARRRGAARVIERYDATQPLSRLWLLNTDADSEVPPNWITAQLDLARAGADAVAGVVELLMCAKATAALFEATYLVRPDASHDHVHGANLGVRADAYVDAGGWKALSVAEDHDLWQRLKLRGWQTLSTAQSSVRTSGRLHGRAAGGFADTLRRLVQEGAA